MISLHYLHNLEHKSNTPKTPKLLLKTQELLLGENYYLNLPPKETMLLTEKIPLRLIFRTIISSLIWKLLVLKCMMNYKLGSKILTQCGNKIVHKDNMIMKSELLLELKI